MLCDARNAHKFPDSVVFAQDMDHPFAGEQSWLSFLLALRYAEELAGGTSLSQEQSSDNPSGGTAASGPGALLVIDDLLRFEQAVNAKTFFSMTQLTQAALSMGEWNSRNGQHRLSGTNQ